MVQLRSDSVLKTNEARHTTFLQGWGAAFSRHACSETYACSKAPAHATRRATTVNRQ